MPNDYKKKSQAQRMSEYNITPAGIKPGETLEHAYRRLAKQADQRLVRLEAASREKGYEGIKTYAYGLAMKNIKSYSGEDATRFNTKPPVDQKQLQAKVNDMIQFLNSPTSTKSGVTAMYKKRTETLNRKYGTNFTWQEAGRFFEDKKDSFNKDWNSSLILKSIGKLQKNADTIKNELQESADRHKVVSDEDINNAIYEKLSKNGINAGTLLDDVETPKKSTATKRTKKSSHSRRSAKRKKSTRRK